LGEQVNITWQWGYILTGRVPRKQNYTLKSGVNPWLYRGIFPKKTGSLNCRELISYDLTTMEGRNRLHEDKEAMIKCKHFLATASKLLNGFIK